MAYMRGGSSLFGQIFQRMNNSIYFYEPLDGFYTSYAAIHHWQIPLDITHTGPGITRYTTLMFEFNHKSTAYQGMVGITLVN